MISEYVYNDLKYVYMYMTYVTWYGPGILPNAAVKPKYRESACQTFTHGFYSYTGGICGIVHVYICIKYMYIHVLYIVYTDPDVHCTLLRGLLHMSVCITVTPALMCTQ